MVAASPMAMFMRPVAGAGAVIMVCLMIVLSVIGMRVAPMRMAVPAVVVAAMAVIGTAHRVEGAVISSTAAPSPSSMGAESPDRAG